MWRPVLITACLLAGLGTPSDAEIDVAAALVGRWEGKTEVRSADLRPERILIIKSLRQDSARPDGSRWKADADYGLSAERSGRVDMTVTVVDPAVTVEFVSGHALHVTLKLVKPNVLEGTHLAGGGHAFRMRLERRQ